MSAAEWAMVLALGFLWGGSFFFAKVAVGETGPFTLVLLRVAIAGAALQLYLAATGVSFWSAFRPNAARFVALGVFNNVIPFSLIFLGQTRLGAGVASVINATTPFWTMLIAAYAVGSERLTPNRVAGIALGIAGTALMIGPEALAAVGGPAWPKLALIGASLSYAVALFIARGIRETPPAVLAAGQLSVATVVLCPLLLAPGTVGRIAALSGTGWAAILALALASSAFAYLLYFRILASAGATNASLVTLVVPASAILLGAAFLGERLGLFEILGLAAIAAGLLAVDGRVLRLLVRRGDEKF